MPAIAKERDQYFISRIRRSMPASSSGQVSVLGQHRIGPQFLDSHPHPAQNGVVGLKHELSGGIEYHVRYGRNGRPVERHLSVGEVVITTVAGVILALSAHTIWMGLAELCRSIKWW